MKKVLITGAAGDVGISAPAGVSLDASPDISVDASSVGGLTGASDLIDNVLGAVQSLPALPIDTSTLSDLANTASALVPAVSGQALGVPGLIGGIVADTPLGGLLPSLPALPIDTSTVSDVTDMAMALAPAVLGQALGASSLVSDLVSIA